MRVLEAMSLAATLPQLPLPTTVTLDFEGASSSMEGAMIEKEKERRKDEETRRRRRRISECVCVNKYINIV